MHITGMSIGAIPPISERITIKFDERVNVFIGPNASGKSTVLLVLANHFGALDDKSKRPLDDIWEMDHSDDEFDDFVGEMTEDNQYNAIGISEDWLDRYANLDEKPKIMPVVHIGSARIGLPGISVIGNAYTDDTTATKVLAEPFSGLQVQRAFETLGQEAWGIESSSAVHEERRNFARAVETADACSMMICKEVIRDSAPHNYIPGWDLRGYLAHPVADLDKIRVIRGAAINTNDARDFEILPHQERPDFAAYYEDAESVPIYLGHLSSGTEGTLLWIRWLAFKMVHHYGFKDEWEKQPAILLIDEIENHLHPTWQRRVIPALLEHFPGLQIFATTHSPFVVAGLKAGQVHLLNRDADGVVTATTNTEAIVGWTADEILRTMMGVDDPTDDETARNAAELRQLRNEGPRAAPEEEEQRQAEMQRLRRLVNRDLLAGGPAAAQRELFEQQFAEALEKYQQSHDLSQENG